MASLIQQSTTDIFSFLKTAPHIEFSAKLITSLAQRFGVTQNTLNILITECRKGAGYAEN